jgi:DNA processing protein
MEMSDKNVEAAVALNMTPGLGSRTFMKLHEHFGSAEAILKASARELAKVEGVPRDIAKRIVETRAAADVEQEFALAQKHGARIIPFWSDEYPQPLRHIHTPPILLYVKGEMQKTDAIAVAIVGARRCSLYGRNQAERIAFELAARGFTIISGLARGVDGAAHEGALKAKGRTIAVLGTGLATIYPREHERLAERICASGALVSEFPMATPVDGRNFPPRNRIISGLSMGAVVVEASRKSGSLITATWAREQGREVFAVPGKIDNPLSLGPHKLIQDGAKLVASVEDIIDELGGAGKKLDTPEVQETLFEKQLEGLNDRERMIADVLERDEAKGIDEISDEAKLPISITMSTLTVLQVKKIVQDVGGKRFVLSGPLGK